MTLFLLIVILVPALIVGSYPLFTRRALNGAGPAKTEVQGGKMSVIVPCHGLEDGQAERIASLLGQEFGDRVEILFCVESADDPVVTLLDDLLPSVPGGLVRLMITGPAGPDLGKMHNLVQGYAAATGDRLVFLDSDVLLPDPGYLDRFAARLAEPGVGLVTCFPAYRDFLNIPAAVLAFMINNDLLGLFSLMGAGGNLRVANGSCLAVDRAALEKSGGLAPLRRQLLMDTALARNIQGAGYRVLMHDEAAPVPAGRMTWGVVRAQSRRWHMAMWRVLPRLQYFGYAWLRGGTLLGLAGWLLSGGETVLAAALAVALTSRFFSAWLLDRDHLRSGSFFRYCWLLPAVEMMNGWDVFTAPLGNGIRWRGRDYILDKHGKTIPRPSVVAQGKGDLP